MATDRYPKGKFACVLCGHDVAKHNLMVGCPACTCAASPGEALSNSRVAEPYEGRILAISETRSHYATRVPYGAPVRYPSAEPKDDTVQCPTCLGSGSVAVGPWGKRPPKATCRLCQGKGKLARTVADAWRVGVEMGRDSAYLGHFDQYDTGSLMFGPVESPYEPGFEIPAEHTRHNQRRRDPHVARNV